MRTTPWEVGEKDAIAVVGVQGEITDIDDDTVTIAGVTLPRTLGAGVRYLSMVWPDEPRTEPCSRLHADGQQWEDLEADSTALTSLAKAVETLHTSEHSGAMRYCAYEVCSRASDVLR